MSDRSEGEFARQLLDCQRHLYAYIMSLVFDRDVADDLLQQTNLVLCQKADQAAKADSFGAWTTGVARLEVMSYRRRTRNDKHLFDNDLVDLLASESPAAKEASQIRIAAVRYCIEKLPPKQQELVRERYSSDAQVKELAGSRGQTIEAISKALYRSRKSLKECIRRRLRKEETS